VAAIVFIGFGELAGALAGGLVGKGHQLRAYTRGSPSGERLARLDRASVSHSLDPKQVLRGADTVLVTVPGSACVAVAELTAPLLSPGVLYVDLATAAPQDKLSASQLVAPHGADYVDAAVLGTVVVSAHRVPILASGPGAERFRALAEADGLVVSTLDAAPGQAALVKLLRSVFLKGRDALIMQMMLAARRHGLEDTVIQSIDTPSERVSFPDLVERVLCSLALHAGRRGAELAQAGQILEQAGIDPALSQAGAQALLDLAALDLPESFGHRRPSDGGAVLREIDKRWRRPG
jgi:3-hydroxyisobutyrate dehydrogenase-like beta-hydroxyacid dehydrogenase